MVLFHVARKGGFLSFWAHRCSVTARRQFYVVASTLWCGKQNAIVTASGRLAQLVRALPSHGRGHWFESSIAHTLTRHPSGRAGVDFRIPGLPDGRSSCNSVRKSQNSFPTRNEGARLSRGAKSQPLIRLARQTSLERHLSLLDMGSNADYYSAPIEEGSRQQHGS